MRGKNVDMLNGPVFKGLLAMTIPIMIMNVMTTMFNIIDMTVLGNFSSDEGAVGAVGVCGTLITLCSSLLIGISAGANVVVAHSIGQKDREKTARAVGTALLFSVLGGLILLVVGVLGSETFLRWINCPEKLLTKAVLYFRLYFAGVPIIMLNTFGQAILRAAGDTRHPMLFSIINGIVKVTLTVFFVMFFDMSVDGVAIATIISNLVAAVLAIITILRSNDVIHFSFKYLKIYGTEFKRMLFIGIPTGLQSALYSLANAVITSAVNSFGPEATTGVSIANQFDGILYQVAVAPSLAVIPYVAQNVGTGNFKRVKEAVVKGTIITVIFGASLGALSAIFSSQLSSLMSKNPEEIAYSCQKMIIISSTYFICGINEVMGGAMRGLGRPIIPTIATLIFMCALRFVWVYFIFPLCPNLTFLYLVWPIGWVCCIATILFFYFPTLRKLQKKAADEKVLV